MVMCGYPSGDESLDIFMRYRGLRVRHIIQFGHITGLMPTDDVMIPWGVQTNIMGTEKYLGLLARKKIFTCLTT
jgi:hypothetical protein